MNPKYLPTTFGGRYARVIEEAGEALQMIGKIGRFGMFSKHPDGGDHNAQLLLGELRDLQDAIAAFEPDLVSAIETHDRGMIAPLHLTLRHAP